MRAPTDSKTHTQTRPILHNRPLMLILQCSILLLYWFVNDFFNSNLLFSPRLTNYTKKYAHVIVNLPIAEWGLFWPRNTLMAHNFFIGWTLSSISIMLFAEQMRSWGFFGRKRPHSAVNASFFHSAIVRLKYLLIYNVNHVSKKNSEITMGSYDKVQSVQILWHIWFRSKM